MQLFKEIYADRKLLIALSKKDFVRRFAGSYFGVSWGFIQPALTILVYWIVFQFGFRSGSVDDVPFILWFVCGIVAWLFISEAFSTASNSFLEYSYLVKKVVFNINILPLVKICSSFYIHLFFIMVAFVISMLFGYFPTLMTLQIVYYMLCSVVGVFALSLIFSSIMVFFRDLGQIISILLLIGMWCTPIAWNMDTFSPKAQFLLKLNPNYYIIEGYRDSILGRGWFWERPYQTLYFWGVTILIIIIGVTIYNRLKIHFADTL